MLKKHIVQDLRKILEISFESVQKIFFCLILGGNKNTSYREALAQKSQRSQPFSSAVLQGSTLRKRKMYEEFLSKVSILGEFCAPCHTLQATHSSAMYSVHMPGRGSAKCRPLKPAVGNIYGRLAHINAGACLHRGAATEPGPMCAVLISSLGLSSKRSHSATVPRLDN